MENENLNIPLNKLKEKESSRLKRKYLEMTPFGMTQNNSSGLK